MKLAFSTNAFTNMTLPEAVAAVGRLGYEGVEILADVPHAFPPRDDAPWVLDVKWQLERYDIKVSNINGNTAAGFFRDRTGEPTFEPSLCNAAQDVRRQRINYTKGCIDLANVLGASNISITSGMCLPGNPPRQALKFLRESLEELVDYAEQREVNIGIEYEPGLLIENGQELFELMQVVASPKLGVNLDVGHVQVIGEDLDILLKKLGPRIWNVHLEDIDRQKHYHLIPGEGTMDFHSIIGKLRHIGYDRYITVELYTYVNEPVNAAERSISFLRPLVKSTEGEIVNEVF